MSHNNPAAAAVASDSAVADVIAAVGFPWGPADVVVSGVARVHVQIVSAQIVSAQFVSAQIVSAQIVSGTNCIGNKLYREHIVSGTNCIGNKLYRAQIVSAPFHFFTLSFYS